MCLYGLVSIRAVIVGLMRIKKDEPRKDPGAWGDPLLVVCAYPTRENGFL